MTPDTKLDMSGPALRALLTIAREWRLSERERRDILGGPTSMTLAAWEKAAKMRERVRVPDAVLDRIQMVLQIRIGIKKPMPDPTTRPRPQRLPRRQGAARCHAGEQPGAPRVRNLTDNWSSV